MALKKLKIGGHGRWRVRVTCHGRNTSRLLPLGASRMEARQVEAALVEELRAVAAQGTPSIIVAPTLEHACDSYVQDLSQRGKSLSGIGHVKASKNRLAEFFGQRMQKPVVDLTANDLFDSRQFLLDKALRPSTINGTFRDLRAALHVAWPSFQFPKNLFLQEEFHYRALNPDELQEVVTRLSPPYQVIAELSGVTVLRLTEIVGLRRGQVDLSAGVIHLEDRVIVLGARARQILEKQLRSHNSEWVFPAVNGQGPLSSGSVTRRWRRASLAAGLSHLTFHSLRHLAVQQTVMEGASTSCLMLLGGWKSPQSLDRFAFVNRAALRRAAEAIAKTMGPVFTKKLTKKSGGKKGDGN